MRCSGPAWHAHASPPPPPCSPCPLHSSLNYPPPSTLLHTLVQERNLSAALGLPVMDRVALIIAIFAKRAYTREARLQVWADVLTDVWGTCGGLTFKLHREGKCVWLGGRGLQV